MIVPRERVPTGDNPFVNGRKFERQYIECKATGGSLRLTFRGATTQPPTTLSAVEVKGALEALHTIGSVSITGDVFCVLVLPVAWSLDVFIGCRCTQGLRCLWISVERGELFCPDSRPS